MRVDGWTGFRVRVDLTNRKYEVEPLSLEYYRKWMGAEG